MAPSLHPDMARCLRPLVGNNRLKKKSKFTDHYQEKNLKIKQPRAIQLAVKAERRQALGFLQSQALNSMKTVCVLDTTCLGNHWRDGKLHIFKVCDTFCHELALVRSEVALLLYTLVVQTHFTKLVFQPKQHSESTCRMPDTQRGCIHVLYPYPTVPT